MSNPIAKLFVGVGVLLVLGWFAMPFLAALIAAIAIGKLSPSAALPDYSKPPQMVYGCIDKSNKLVIPAKYLNIGNFHEGLAMVDGKGYTPGSTTKPCWGFMDRSGKIVIEPTYDFVGNFSEGLAAVGSSYGGIHCGYIGRDGRLVIDLNYAAADEFKNGKARVELSEMQNGFPTSKQLLIDKTGKVAPANDLTADTSTLPDFRDQGTSIGEHGVINQGLIFSEGLAPFRADNGGWGYVDRSRNWVIAPQFTDAHNFSEGLAAVCMNNKWGFINRQGNIVIPVAYREVSSFREGRASFREPPKTGFIDTHGKVVIPAQFRSVSHFCDGLAKFEDDSGKFGFIDMQGKVVIPPTYTYASDFSEGLAAVGIPYNEKSAN